LDKINKKELSEIDICDLFITPAIKNAGYFGEPVYTYSLKQGIADGFLAPYKVVRIDMDKDLYGWDTPSRHDR